MGVEAFASFRLKSERRKTRLRKDDQDKQLLKLHREERKLNQQIRNLGYEPLIPPIQKGWNRIFVLREDVQRSTQAEFFQRLLDKINTTQHSNSKKFTARKRRQGRKYYVAKQQKLRHFDEAEWRKKPLTDAEACLFTQSLIQHPKGYRLVYELAEPWRYVLKVVPNMITEVKVRDSLLEQRVNEIDNYLERNNLEPKLLKLLHGHRRYGRWTDFESPKYANPLDNKPLYKIISELD